MPNNAAVYARIDPVLKEEVDIILKELQITPSALIQMLYGQIKLTKGIPFELKIPSKKPVFIDEISKYEMDIEIAKGYKDVEEGRVFSEEEANGVIKRNLGI